MHLTRVFWIFLSAFFVLAFLHNLAVAFYLYWTYLWFDIPMHALGGFVVALGYVALILAYTPSNQESRLVGFIPTMIAVLLVGILWEVFEVSIDTPGRGVPDTLLDLVMDLVGGALGYIVSKHNYPAV